MVLSVGVVYFRRARDLEFRSGILLSDSELSTEKIRDL